MPSPIHHLLQQTGSSGGLGGVLNSAEFIAALRDLGAGVVDTALDRGVVPATFTRSTAAASKLSTGLWKLDVASGSPRSSYIGLTTAVGTYGGYLAEGQRTNLCIQSRDSTNVAWTNTSITAAKTSTGIDGVTNSCSRLTATGANGTSLQAITVASAAKTFSVWIKRVTGTGNIFITLDNDATRTDVTASINSATFTLVQMTQTLANPTVGIKIATSTDAIDVDIAQLEDTASFASTPIPTTTVAVTRNTDLLTYPSSGNVLGTSGSAYAEATAPTASIQTEVISTRSGNLSLIGRSSLAAFIFDGTSTQNVGTWNTTALAKVASSWGGATMSILFNGSVAGVAFDGDMNVAGLAIGNDLGGGRAFFGTIKNVHLWMTKLSDAALQSLTT